MEVLEKIGNNLNLVLGFVKRMDDSHIKLLESHRKLTERLDE